uniref:MULE transposase domain-containing protein n=1 Tax=Cajanus cajan TaxID=3821 RepID=A0A151TFU6_CAJCA|nr:hypothetical protein KK1_012169 [Cajanus cajan]
MISQTIREIIESDLSRPISIIIAHIKSTMGYTITYRKGWLAKQLVIEDIFGNWEELYHKLPSLLQAMQLYILKFIWKLNTQPTYQGDMLDEGNVFFTRLFWTFKPCIDGFAHCKPIVQVDGTFLYDKYKGTLLVVVVEDGRNNIILIAFAVVEGETSDAWEKWTLAWDNERRWGHMTTNLAESINSILKKTRNLPICSIIMATYTYYNKFFIERGRECFNGNLNTGHVYLEVTSKIIQDTQSKANTHRVITFDRISTRFLVEETQHLREIRPTGRFIVRLDEMWYDCDKFQKVHISCSHVIVVCLHAHHNFNVYVSPIYTLQQISRYMKDNLEIETGRLLTNLQWSNFVSKSRI